MLYHRDFPMGKVFDTETNKKDPYIGNRAFWFGGFPGESLHDAGRAHRARS
jgi:hypothetical protein